MPQQYMLVLEVRLNGARSEYLWEFESLPDGSLATSAERLRRLGFDLDRLGVSPQEPLVRLNDLPGVTYRYLAPSQSIEIEAVDTVLVPVVLDAAQAREPIDPERIERHWGAVLNYGLFGDAGKEGASLSGQYELRLLSPVGTVSSTGYGRASTSGPEATGHVRLDTVWRYVDVRRAIVFAAGDVISDGGELGSVYRLGGIQVRRDYGNRADLVTMAMPIFSGTAAVPSTVDLYINGQRYFTGETGRGPFQFRSLPNVGRGTATVVLTDAVGRETRIEQPLFFAPGVLPRGLLDFSVEAGFPRLHYGTRSFDYAGDPAASGSVRYGATDWLTVRAHAEGMSDFANGSVGGTARIGQIGTISTELAASVFRGHVDTRWSVDLQGHLAGVNFYAGIERANAGYQDVVRMTDLKALQHANEPDPAIPVPPVGPVDDPQLLAFSRKTERAGINFLVFETGVSVDYTRFVLPRQESRILSASLSHALFERVSVWASGFRDFGDRDDYGVFFGVNLPLGGRIWASSSYARNSRGSSVSTRVSREPDGSDGSWGWALASTEALTGPGASQRSATVRYNAPFARLEGSVRQFGDEVHATGYMEGSVVVMGGGTFASRRIDDAFAVVQGAGADTPVLSNTRVITRTDRSGRALVAFLASLQENVIGIDPSELPVDLTPARTEAVVVPDYRGGVIVNFGVEQLAAAIVILVDDGGTPLPVGSIVRLEGSDQPAVVGFDGRAFLTDLAARNRIHVRREGGLECSASFDFAAVSGQQVVIGPLPCL